MENLLSKVPDVLLMGPGPSCVYPEVYKALSAPTLGHLDGEFIRIMDETKGLLRDIMNTENAMTFPVSGTGSAGMETCFVNIIEPGDPVLVLVNGVFGTRMSDVASRLGAKVTTVEAEWGTPIRVEEVRKAISAGTSYKLVAAVHAETSTGVLNPVDEIGKIVAGTDALYLVDGVTSLGGLPVKLDEWGADLFYSGTQKCLSVPPGLAPCSFSDRALKALKQRSSKVPNWYLDVSMLANYWEGAKRAYHHTAPINMIYALYQSLLTLAEEGHENSFARHKQCHEQLVRGLEKIGVELMVDEPARLPMLNAVKVPDGVDEESVRTRLRSEHNIEVGAGLGPLAGKIWRVGLMGHTARPENVDRFLDALAKVL